MDMISSQLQDISKDDEENINLRHEITSVFDFSFQGRYGRLNYINAVFIITLVGIIIIGCLYFVNLMMITNNPYFLITSSKFFIALYIIAGIFLSFFMIRITVLRLHDLEKTGWFSLLLFLSVIPYVGVIFLSVFYIYLVSFPGKSIENKYGFPSRRGSGLGIISLLILLFLSALIYLFVLPAYYTYDKRARVVESFELLDVGKQSMIEYYGIHKAWPSSNEEASLPPASYIRGIIVDGVEVKNNAITITYNKKLDYKTIIFVPKIIDGQYLWDCKGGTLPYTLRPKDCR
ncbi:DUF805 domain-containing protein [Wohlfahrtiimonas populi]|uniref:DUF805 domain-containing protein n=1 Tax=Wohlfahrtiimonas populi TaxID=1940240 RepID=UPI00098D15A1|nr:DUF805 domain-containing protein [Wohlfahrtiimonas populi]